MDNLEKQIERAIIWEKNMNEESVKRQIDRLADRFEDSINGFQLNVSECVYANQGIFNMNQMIGETSVNIVEALYHKLLPIQKDIIHHY